MLYIDVKCFETFRCIAGRCPDTCCAGWEVDLDENTAEKYFSLPGALGQEIRENICTEDGYTFFRLSAGRCPFLNEKNLCRIILEQGDGCLSVTCREHPRFWDEYGVRQETCLAISCPEAARLLLSQPFSLVVRETQEPEILEDAPDEGLFTELLSLRDELFFVARQSIPMEARLGQLAKTVSTRLPEEKSLSGYLSMMKGLEFTDDRLPRLLDRTLEALPSESVLSRRYQQYNMEAENLLLYFLYRYVLRAVWDGLVLEPVLFSLYSLQAIFAMAEAMDAPFPEALTEAAVRYSREVEHSPENIDAIYEFLTGNS